MRIMNIEPPVFADLKAKFGSHSDAARQIGISPRQYRDIRRTRRTTRPLHKLILLLHQANAECMKTLEQLDQATFNKEPENV